MTSIIHIVYLVLIVVVVWLSIKKLAPGEVSQSPLSTSEKIIVWLLCIVNPVFAVIVFYYGWRKRLPAKAKESNKLGNEMLEDHKEKIKEAHHEASVLTNQAVRDSERIKSEKIHALSINLQKEKEQALKKIKEEEKIAQKELTGKIKTLVDLIMTKIIRQEKDLVRT